MKTLKPLNALLMPVCAGLLMVGNAHAQAAQTSESGTMEMNMATNSANSAFAQAMMQSMETMDKGMAAAPMTGDPDRDFAAMMIPHHQGAVDMAKAELLHGKDPVLKRLAQEIIVTQQQEIEVMRRRLAELPPAATNAIRNKLSDPVCSASISTNHQSGNPTNTNHNP